jgi:phosphoribosylglycinamide formyltransferase-1
LSSGAKWVALSGWVKFVKGLDPKCTFNIHPANLTQLNGRFGGYGMYGDNVHKAVKMALSVGELSKTGITMHFVTEDDEYDNGPIFFLQDVLIGPRMSVKQIAESVNESEHRMQPFITNLVVNGKISWDGIDKDSITYPDGYKWYPGSISC